MSAEENKSVVRRFLEEVVSQGDFSKTGELLAPNLTVYHPALPGPVDIEGFRQALTMFRTAFPDLTIMIEDLVAEGDKVMARFTASGTHQSDFMGIAPTGKRVSFGGIGAYRLEGGKIVEDRVAEDLMGLMQQINTIPAGQAMRALIEQARHQFNAGNLEGYIETLYASDAIFHYFPSELPQGHEGAKIYYGVFMAAFSDAQFTPDDITVDGDRMTIRYHLDMTHQGEFQGIQATGRQVTMKGITVLRFAGGKVVERWNESDFMGLMMQLGALPVPAQPA